MRIDLSEDEIVSHIAIKGHALTTRLAAMGF